MAGLAGCAVGWLAVSGLGGWRFGRLAVWAIGGLRVWRVAGLASCAIGGLRGWPLVIGDFRWVVGG